MSPSLLWLSLSHKPVIWLRPVFKYVLHQTFKTCCQRTTFVATGYYDQISWTASIIQAIWSYSITMWQDHCEEIHGNKGKELDSTNRKEIVSLLHKELRCIENCGEFETQQLWNNILKSMGNAQTQALQTWLGMIRDVKESKILHRHVDRIRALCMQSITIFLSWTANA